ncbi:MAG: methionyl-tRNA formyltransferase [Verrucomicrobiales bacterium]|nr:methionyl-tRNA formyltransferase [Verrucomicrobiales bacterium]
MRIVFMGTGEIALPSFHWLLEKDPNHEVVGVFTQPDKKIGRKQILTAPEVKVIAEEADLPVFQPQSFRKDEEALAALRSLAPDITIVMAYGQILPQSVIETPSLACVNLHASLLPRHRGASPIQAAIREGDSETGITLMHIVSKLDAGDIILQESIKISDTDTGGSLHDRLADLGPSVLQRGLPLFANGTAGASPQEESLVTYSGKLEREDGKIDWNRPAKDLELLIRAYDPWPGTYTGFPHQGEMKKVKVFPHCEVGESASAAPGTIIDTDGGIRVACASGSLVLKGELQLEGRKRLPVTEFLRGVEAAGGVVLGGV